MCRQKVLRRVCQAVGFLAVVFFVGATLTPLPNLLSRWLAASSEVGPAEAIVVLGGGLYRDGTLTNASLRRALHGIVLYRKGYAPLVVFSGRAYGEGPVGANVQAELARELGVRPETILTEGSGETTRDQARRIKDLLRPRRIQKILLVTDSQHLRRAQPLFQRAGFVVFSAPVDMSGRVLKPEQRLWLMRRVVEELLARLYYYMAGYIGKRD